MLNKHKRCLFHMAVAQGIEEEKLRAAAEKYDIQINYHKDKIYDLMGICDAALATSGTVVLEAALMGLPCVVLYKMTKITYCVGKLFVHVRFFSLPNILAGRKIIPELLQDEVTPLNVTAAVEKLLQRSKKENKKTLYCIKDKLGVPGVAQRTAKLILETADKGRYMTPSKQPL